MRTKKLIGTQFACFNTTKAGFCVRPTLDLLAKMFETSSALFCELKIRAREGRG